MNTEHAPETWTAYQNPEDIRSNLWHIRVSEGLEDSLLGYCGERRARLVAAAPELLDALEYIINNCRVFCEDSMDLDDHAIDDARRAIAKARPNP